MILFEAAFARPHSALVALRRVGQDLNASITYNKFLELEPDVEEGDRIQQVFAENGLQEVPLRVFAARTANASQGASAIMFAGWL
jgi:hypothetical protein